MQLPCGPEQWSYWKKNIDTQTQGQGTGSNPQGERKGEKQELGREESPDTQTGSTQQRIGMWSLPSPKGTAPPGHHNTRPLHQVDPSSRSRNAHHLPGVEADSNFVSCSPPPEPHSVDVDTASEQWWPLLGAQSREAMESGRGPQVSLPPESLALPPQCLTWAGSAQDWAGLVVCAKALALGGPWGTVGRQQA